MTVQDITRLIVLPVIYTESKRCGANRTFLISFLAELSILHCNHSFLCSVLVIADIVSRKFNQLFWIERTVKGIIREELPELRFICRCCETDGTDCPCHAG